ncbi:AAA family ATPase [Rhodoferax sp.]|uniref:trifunctional serine/threonine-protein kinase/ATP-binding protein/sensor histidine kinase n=1 Tax=Rhodoferax sp. TaxID=50421 RepID=UPI001EC97D2C|nr:AAA family ATPase [Rhodoferax sp.]MBT9507416.1 AAA family ATPase [Rhodoferax sp.]
MTSHNDNRLSDQALVDGLSLHEVLYRSKKTLITRGILSGSGLRVVFKQALGSQASQRVQHEASILQRLAHIQGVVRIAPVPTSANTLALHDFGGVALSQWLQEHTLAIADVVALGQTLAQVLAEVHRAGILHKDINPSNILLSGPERRPTLIDFNIASQVAEELPGFTHQNQIAGTLRYMAPEQTGRTGRPVDQRADLYSLGVMLYELTMGHPPFESEDLLDLIHDHLVRVPAEPSQSHVPPMLSRLIMRLLEKEPDRRYQSAQGLEQDLGLLQQALRNGDTTPFPLARHDFAQRLSPPSRPVGRDPEIAALQHAITEAMADRTRCVLVEGMPGVGKTALINELRPLVAAQRGWFVSGKFDQYRQDAPTATVEALRALGRLLLAEPEDQLVLHRARLLDGLGSNSGFGPVLLPEFVMLLGPQPGVEVVDPREAEVRLIQTTLDLLRSIATPERPVVMVLDDLQWAPHITLRFLDALVNAAEGIAGLLLVGSFRANEVDAAHPLHALMTRWGQLGRAPAQLALRNLDASDVSTLLGEMLRLPQPQAARLAAALQERTEGNPYDTVEMVNALRQDGLLTPRDGLWDWDASAIHQYVGNASLMDILQRRIARLPPPSRDLLELMACLGGELSPGVLSLASGLNADELALHWVPPLEDGLLVIEQGESTLLRFRHDRVQQTVFEGMAPGRRRQQHLRLARQLAQHSEFSHIAAEQYLPVAHVLVEETECRHVVSLFQQAAVRSQVLNYAVAERFLAAAFKLLQALENPSDAGVLAALEIAHHAALYGLGRLEECDAVYAAIVARNISLIELAEPAGIQMYSLANRGLYLQALALGLKLLDELGLKMPSDPGPAIEAGLYRLEQWLHTDQCLLDFQRAEVSDPLVLAWAKLSIQTANAGYFCDPVVFAWITLEATRLWIEHGPCRQLLMSIGLVPFLLGGQPQNFRGAYRVARHLLAVGEARGYEHATAITRTVHGIAAGHWVEPIENVVVDLHQARERLVRAGDFTFAAYTFISSSLLFDCAPTLDAAGAEVETGLSIAKHMGDAVFRQRYLPRRQLVRAMRGETRMPGGFSDDSFEEGIFAREAVTPGPMAVVYHTMRMISAAIFDDSKTLSHHAALAMSLGVRTPGAYLVAVTQVLQGVALANQARTLPLEERGPLLEEIDADCLPWLTLRAADAPVNFLHLQFWLHAERAWAGGDIPGAMASFDAAMAAAAEVTRPWHRALITERAGLLHAVLGADQRALSLLTQACAHYEAWGAAGKVRAMQREHLFLRTGSELQRAEEGVRSTTGTSLSTDTVDMLAVLRASQALSSETSLSRLTGRLGQVMGAMTGASAVHLVIQPEDRSGWFMADSLGADASPVPVEQAGKRGDLALSVFRYVQRTGETLLLDDATQDDRFNRDPYIAALAQCSILCAPILSHGELRAMLLLESRQRRGAFSAERLDAVMLIAGQMAVSLDNALLYASLEQRVQQRTEKLEQALERLERTKDELVRSEKLAALGSLVAGVAHELNTPIGNGLTVASSLEFKTTRFVASMASGLTRSNLDQFVADTQFACDILVRNLSRAGELISSFKQVAVDQTSSQRRQFDLQEVASEIVLTLSPTIRHCGCAVVTDISPNLTLDSYPGPLGQVLSNLISNAMIHGYSDGQGGLIEVQARAQGQQEVELQVRDHGRGVERVNLKRIFEPFYTTRLGQGGSGLGLHIVHNIVTGVLGGQIEVQSTPGEGTVFTLRLPLRAPQATL